MAATKEAQFLEDKRSLVCPENCGSVILTDKIKEQFSIISSPVNFIARGNKLRKSQNSRIASSKPVRSPFT